jgi:hypothetical protein
VTITEPPGRPRDGRAVAVYTAARLALFAVCVAVLWLVGFSGLLLVLVALVVSGVLSLFLLQRQRLAVSGAVERRLTRGRERLRARTAAEDAYADRLHEQRRTGAESRD